MLPDEYRALCRSDPQVLALARRLSKELQDVSVALFRALAVPSAFYLPRTGGGTNGEGEELNVIDRADIADYCSFLCCVARGVLLQYRSLVAPDGSNDITSQAGTRIVRSVSEALLITFFQRRFPGLSAPMDVEMEGVQPGSAEEGERGQRHFDRVTRLFRKLLSLFATYRQAAQALPPVFVRGEDVRTGRLVAIMLEALERSVHSWADLRILSDFIKTPRSVALTAAPSAAFRHPLPDLALLRCLEGPNARRIPPAGSTSRRHFAGTSRTPW